MLSDSDSDSRAHQVIPTNYTVRNNDQLISIPIQVASYISLIPIGPNEVNPCSTHTPLTDPITILPNSKLLLVRIDTPTLEHQKPSFTCLAGTHQHMAESNSEILTPHTSISIIKQNPPPHSSLVPTVLTNNLPSTQN